ncbi:TetR/AcrR family transcriptional regulator [Vulgatibacter incomptus]|uniref:Fatty acid degradation regulator YsiA, TetR family n=1 Tax=Vulgatibacter incomptus TaxID=1391653 RepID=A0A0K1PE24_9BACT|nr:TetR/AcrR family transcriptional regulator [Vulgatibacter incomptus]AKU91760.1 Fatty acid degradation regulator YsiA, TetR family [Vulgatibacter incomptus]
MADGTISAREQAKGDKRARIVDAAIRVFAEKGFHLATVAEVAREAGVADGTIYLYFKNKDDLLACLFEERMVELNALMSAELAKTDGALEQLRTFVRTHLRMVQERPALAQVLIVELRQSARLVKAHKAAGFASYLDILGRIIEAGAADGSVRAGVDTRSLRRAIFGALDEVALSWLLGGRRFDLEKNAEQLAELFARGLAAGT